MTSGARLRNLMKGDRAVVAPGVFNPLLARMCERAGFSALYAGGSAISVHLFGRPDLGLTSLSERVSAVRRITDVTDLPLLVDADTGFGAALALRHCVRQFEKAGVAGLHVEDETAKTTHQFGATTATVEEMQRRIQIAVDSRHSPDFMIFARCNTLRSHGVDETATRCQAYVEAGADGLFVLGMSPSDATYFAASFVGIPQIYNMSVRGDGPKMTVDELSLLGYKLVILPNLLSLGVVRMAEELLQEVRLSGSIKNLLHRLASADELDAISGLNEGEEYQQSHSVKVEHERGGA